MRAAWRGVVSAGGAHPHRPLRGTAGGPPGSWDKLVPAHPKALPCPMLIEPAAWEQPDMRAALAARDVGTVYRLLRQVGVSQRQIAALTGQSQSEVSEIIKGRQVIAYDVLVRLAVGLGIPREYMGLSYGEHSTYSGSTVTKPPAEEVDEDVQRRDALAVGFLASLGFVPPFAALLDDSAAPREIPLPSRGPLTSTLTTTRCPPRWTSVNAAGPLTSTRAPHGRPTLHLESERPARDRGFESLRFRPLTRHNSMPASTPGALPRGWGLSLGLSWVPTAVLSCRAATLRAGYVHRLRHPVRIFCTSCTSSSRA